MICYQISKKIDIPIALPPMEKCSNSDSNHGLGDDWVKMVVMVKYPEKSSYSYSSYYTSYKSFPVPRVLWLKKSWNMQQVHWKFFTFFRQVIKNWYELGMNKELQFPLNLVRGKTEEEEGEKLDWDQFLALPIEEQYKIIFPEMSKETAED